MLAFWGLLALSAACRSRSAPEIERSEAPHPSAPRPGEPTAEHPCGTSSHGPCLLIGQSYSNWARGYVHRAWFLDTTGRELTFSFRGRDKDDPVRAALRDEVVTEQEFAQIVAVSTEAPPRVTPAELNQALLLLTASRSGAIERTSHRPCPDAGGSSIYGLLFDAARGGSVSFPIEEASCHRATYTNTAPAAQELSSWVHFLLGGQ